MLQSGFFPKKKPHSMMLETPHELENRRKKLRNRERSQEFCGSNESWSAMEDPAGLRNYLFCVGVDLLRHSRGRQRSSAFSLLRHALPGRGTPGLRLGDRAGRARTKRAAMDIGISAGVSHLRCGLWAFVLGRDARAFGHCGGDTGYDSGFHGAGGDCDLRTQRLTFRLAAALVAGIAGVAILMIRSTDLERLGSLGSLGKLAGRRLRRQELWRWSSGR